jgi:glycerate 2-kinase
MRILIAPDKFKGCLSAREVAKAIASGIGEVSPRPEIDLMPIADGGEGTSEVICNALHGSWVTLRVHDPIGRQIECRYAMIEEQRLAVIEMSEAAGMRRLDRSELDPLRATTFGVGQLILDAIRRGAGKIIVGLGGSATNDGGFGLARALGYRFFDGEGMQVRSAVNKLRTLKLIETPRNLSLPPIVGAADVQNQLLGKHGATRTFGPQKGATFAELALLEKCLRRIARVAARQVRPVSPKTPGAGAAGGLGFGLMAFAGATLRPGFQVVADIIGAESRIKKADVVITGEGRLDAQTLNGKAPAGIAHLASKHGKPVFAIVGEWRDHRKIGDLFNAVFELSSIEPDKSRSIAIARELLRASARDVAAEWQPG